MLAMLQATPNRQKNITAYTMKIKSNQSSVTIALAICLSFSLLSGKIEQPRHVFCAEDFQKAKALALEEHLPVLVVRTDLESRCGWTDRFTSQMFNEYRSVAVIVVLQSSTWENAPAYVRRNVHSDKLGSTIPRVGLFNADLNKTLMAVPYAELKDNNSEVTHQLRRKMRQYTAETRANRTAIPTGPDAPSQRTWTDVQGRTILATMRRFNTESVRLQRDDGMFFTIALETLSPQDRQYLMTYQDTRYYGDW